jgi:glycine cleavage system H protein
VVIGISVPLEKILGEPYKITDIKLGSALDQGDSFVTIEGFKVSADLPSPVSGTIIQVNQYLKGWMIQGQVIQPLVFDVYNTGWMMAVQLSKPDELKALLTAQQYVNRFATK